MSLSDLHTAGGQPFMLVMDLLGMANIGLLLYIILKRTSQKITPEKPLELMKHFGGLALAWGAFATFVGLFQAFGALEEMKETLPFSVISGGLKVGLITVLYGFIIYMLTLVAYLGVRFTGK